MILQIQYCVDGTGDVMWRHVVFIWIISNMVFTSGLHFSSIPIAKFTKICIICGRSTSLHLSDNRNSPQCCRCNNVGIKTTRRRKIIGEEEVMYFTHYSLQKKKSIQHWIKHSFFISKFLHTFVWSFQSKNLTYVISHSFFRARSGQSRQV